MIISLVFLATVCDLLLMQADGAALKRPKRFILQGDQATGFPFPIPTTYPIPTLPGTGPRPASRNPQASPNAGGSAQQTGAMPLPADIDALLSSAQVSCPVKRSAEDIRITLDDGMMSKLYTRLVGELDLTETATSYAEALKHFRHPGYLDQTKYDPSRTGKPGNLFTTGSLRNDIESLETWLETVSNRNKTKTFNETRMTKEEFLDILEELQITKHDVKYLLGLSHDVDEVIKYYTKTSGRVRRTANGVVSNVEYCHERGTATGTGYLHMCATCALTTQLRDDTFPRFINEADCDASDCDCFTANGSANGKCQPMYRSVKMLRKKSQGCRLLIQDGQQFILDDWTIYDQSVKVGCECVFNKNSMYALFVPRN